MTNIGSPILVWGDEAQTVRFAAVGDNEGHAVECCAQMRSEKYPNATIIRSITEWLPDGRVRVERHYSLA